MQSFTELLKNNTYPGRGIAVGKDAVCYFIMGRSENSRNRVFVSTEDGIRTEAFDPAKMKDPSLIIYHPVRMAGGMLIVTNGDQTDTVRDELEAAGIKGSDILFNEQIKTKALDAFRRALMTREYEPDAPNFTSRISAMILPDGSAELSILKYKEGRCLREFYSYEGFEDGKGVFISTYQHDGNPLPAFAGEPVEIDMPAPSAVWEALNADNKVSLYTNYGGEIKIFNVH